jgi:naphthoate synthase/2-ketocyclohexanecarboxyl-CoA hydrolase
MYEQLIYELADGVATITLNRPEKLNALDEEAYDELRDAFVRAGKEDAAGVVVLRGAGRAFCAGGDVDMARTRLTDERAGRKHFFQRMLPVSDAIVALGKPVVFGVHGACVGGGAEICMFADYVIADESAFFVFNGTATGGCSWWGAPQLLPLLVGFRKAEEIMYFSRRVPAEEAERIGLINRMVAKGELDGALDSVCNELLDLSEDGLRLTKSAFRSTKQMLLAAMQAAAEENVAVMGKGELTGAFSAFREGRQMTWRDLRPGLTPEQVG